MRRRRRWPNVLIILALGLVAVSVLLARSYQAPREVDQAAVGAPQSVATPQPTATPRVQMPIIPTPTPRPPTPTPTVTPTPTPVGPLQTGSDPVPPLSAHVVLLVDEQSGKELYEHNSRMRYAPASLTKIMTALVALEHGNLRDVVTVDYDPTPLYDSTMMWVNPGEKVTLEDLLYGLMLPSGNDAALAIANHIAGSEEAFVEMMNKRAAELGMADTSFANPHGLDEENHYTTAHDLFILSRFAMRDPTFRKLAAAKYWTVKGERTWDVYNMNKLLFIYPGADGIKIGYTLNAGKTIVATVNHEGHRVYAILFNSYDLWTDTPLLFDWAFDNFTWPSSVQGAAPPLSAVPSPTP